MHKLIDYICEELEELERKTEKDGKLTMSEVQYMDILAHAKKNLLKSEEMYEEMEEGEEYSRRSDGGQSAYYRRGGEGSSYARGRGRNARRDSRGRYARDSYSREGGYSRGNYSREGGYSYGDEQMVEELRNLMENAPDERTRMEFEKMIQKMEQMR